jgi:hypothetical protein
VNQYTDPDAESTTQASSLMDVGTSSQSQHQSYTFMPNFSYDLSYQPSFDPYMALSLIGSMQTYFGYLTQSMYHLHLNQQNKIQASVAFQQQEMQARIIF